MIRYCTKHGGRAVYARPPAETETLWDGLHDLCRVMEARDYDGSGREPDWAFEHGGACEYVAVAIPDV